MSELMTLASAALNGFYDPSIDSRLDTHNPDQGGDCCEVMSLLQVGASSTAADLKEAASNVVEQNLQRYEHNGDQLEFELDIAAQGEDDCVDIYIQQADACRSMMAEVADNRNIVSICFNYASFSEPAWNEIVKGVVENKALCSLDFLFCNLSPNQIQRLKDALLEDGRRLERMSFRAHTWDEKSLLALGALLEKASPAELCLEDSSLEDSDLELLGGSLANAVGLNTLRLTGNEILLGADEVDGFVNGVVLNRDLGVLDLESNPLDVDEDDPIFSIRKQRPELELFYDEAVEEKSPALQGSASYQNPAQLLYEQQMQLQLLQQMKAQQLQQLIEKSRASMMEGVIDPRMQFSLLNQRYAKLSQDAKAACFLHLLEQYFHIGNVPPDGNCLFSSVAGLNYPDQDFMTKGVELRTEIMKHMYDNAGEYQMWMEDNVMLNSYITRMMLSRFDPATGMNLRPWAGEVECMALCQKLSCRLMIFDYNHGLEENLQNGAPVSGLTYGETGPVLCLVRDNGNHYRPMMQKQNPMDLNFMMHEQK